MTFAVDGPLGSGDRAAAAGPDVILALLDERDRLREALVEAVLWLEVIAAQDRAKPYRELSRDFIEGVNTAIAIIRAALAGGEE